MKNFIAGILVGLVLCVGVVYAQNSFTASEATFKVYVNGKEFKSDKVPVVIRGSLYFPVRAIGEALNVPVNWNSMGWVEIGTPLVQSTVNANKMSVDGLDIYISYIKQTNGYRYYDVMVKNISNSNVYFDVNKLECNTGKSKILTDNSALKSSVLKPNGSIKGIILFSNTDFVTSSPTLYYKNSEIIVKD
ncbi:MAG: copper amine oxidase N-terminal domain-containing protein [Clostridia bacterium]|nr:copper amine oxidase N-terminal domain-containing protein [Clostridia bacterium]